MLTRAMDRLERIGSSRPVQTVVGACILIAGIVLGSGWQAATTVATEQASSVNLVCGQGGAAARELTVAGTCQQAAAVIAGPRGLTGVGGADGRDGADGEPGTAGADSTVPGPMGPAGTPGAAGPSGEPGKPGADSTVAGPTGEPGKPGADSTVPGPMGPKGDRGEPGPTCPDGAVLQPYTFPDDVPGYRCVKVEQGAPDAG